MPPNNPLLTLLPPEWQRHVENVRHAAARLWDAPAHRHAIDHGPAHAGRVVALLDGLTAGLMAREHALAAEEIYVLLAATHLHAIGLQDEHSEPDPAARWARYPELGAEMIYHTLDDPQAAGLGIVEDPGLVEMIALVVAGHRHTTYPSPDYDDFPLGSSSIRPRLLAALLCLADGLDLDYRRVDLGQLQLLDLEPEQALDWWLHHYVSGVQVQDEFVRIGYRVPREEPAYEEYLPELVEGCVRADFTALRDIFRLYGVKIDIASPKTVRPMRAVKGMPPEVWAAAQARLAHLRGEGPQAVPLSPLVETVRGLLATMGYGCDPLTYEDSLTCFHCHPRGGGLRPPLVVGCKAGPVEVADVQAISRRLTAPEQQGYVVAETRVLSSARDAARKLGRVRVFTQAGFYGELLDFRAYVERLVDDYEESQLARYYVDLGCVRPFYDASGRMAGEDHYKPIDEYVDAWLGEVGSERNHISILGDYGTGKTSFCRQYAARQGRRWLADPDRERIPVLIELRDYNKTLEVDSLVTNALVNQYGVQGATFEAFQRYNADGKLLIFFDGFDEMAQRTGQRTAVDNFWELAKVVLPGSKVILTCRTPYFRTQREAECLLQGHSLDKPAASDSKPHIDLRGRPNFEIVYLEPFADEDIQAVLRARFSDRWQDYWQQIQRIYNLPELARRPVLLDMIARTLPQLREGETLNAAQLYQVYTNLWLERERKKGRTLLTAADRRFFAEELATTMLSAEELSIHYSRIPDRVKTHFGLERAEEIDYFEADVRAANFLNRDEAGNYSFVHKSFMEYFAACRLCRLMLENRATLNGPVPINGEVHLFLNHLLTLEPKAGTGPPFDPPPGFVWVPPGEFILGGEDGLDRHIDRLEEGIFVARTPVTNAQYTRFMEAGGYKHKRLRYWTEEGWKWRKKEKQTQPRYWDDASFNEPEQPVVGVNWHEAVAYCRWLAQTLTLRPGYAVRLPMEQEWEKAARGYDGREYPWNGEWIEARCNTEELGLGKPSPVGRFSPQGDSPYGLWDATGNVWEWTLGGNSALRVLRGGSWVDSRWFARCACQSWSGPSTRWRNVGFRPVIAPSPPVSGL